MSRLLVIGCGRSGTRYMTRVLNAVGVTVEHEKDGKDGRVDWHMTCHDDLSAYDVVLHQVRNPLDSISSIHTYHELSWDFIHAHDKGIVPDESKTIKAMKYWLRWNLVAQERAEITYRIEDVFDVLPDLMARLGKGELTGQLLAAARGISTSDHTRKSDPQYKDKYPDMSWGYLMTEDPALARAVKTIAISFGY